MKKTQEKRLFVGYKITHQSDRVTIVKPGSYAADVPGRSAAYENQALNNTPTLLGLTGPRKRQNITFRNLFVSYGNVKF